MATGLIGATAFGFYVFGDMGYGIVQRHNERKRLMEEQQEPVNLDDLPKPTDENTWNWYNSLVLLLKISRMHVNYFELDFTDVKLDGVGDE